MSTNVVYTTGYCLGETISNPCYLTNQCCAVCGSCIWCDPTCICCSWCIADYVYTSLTSFGMGCYDGCFKGNNQNTTDIV